MSRSALFLVCMAALLMLPAVAWTQEEVLSFEPGGHEACAKAIHMPVPDQNTTGMDQKTYAFECALRDQAIEKKRFSALSRSIEQRSPEERVAYNTLIVSFTAFLDAHIAYENCRGGPWCGVVDENDRVLINYDFLKMAGGFVGEGFPAFTVEDLAREDAALNDVYEKLLARLPDNCRNPDPVFGCVSQAEERETERAWIRYRDAWVTFGMLRWPQVNSDSWAAYLTRQRTKQLVGPAAIPVPVG